MPILFDSEKSIFHIETKNTKYSFQIVLGKYPVHLYYGAKADAVVEEYKPAMYSFSPFYAEHGFDYFPDTCMAEYTGFDDGDFRTCSLKVKNSNGDSTTALKYKEYRIFKGRLELSGLPYADADDDSETLEMTLCDDVSGLIVKVYYTAFVNEDIISRYVSITNGGEDSVTIEKCMSLLLDIEGKDFDMISLYGKHNRERNYQRNPLFVGNQSIFSRRGASSHQFNPFIALCSKNADQQNGVVYGFNFVYSGNFLDEVEVDQTGHTRVQIGLGSENFNWLLQKGDTFVSPEAVMTYSDSGFDTMTHNFHNFTRRHILPPEPFEKRPVVLNTWEACYFDIDEKEMLRFAESAKECGIDMLVMDDGWFGERNNDKAGLGDWFENRNKFKDGLKAFVDKVKNYGIKFGIWVEPEMVNPDSDLFRAHPEWCIQCKNREMMESRYQLVLDMGNPQVIEYLKNIFSKTFDGVSIDYFKWDMNRHLSQVGSSCLPAERQGEAAYRHMLGVYELFRWFREKYPNAMIENCSGGGGRYDLGMMKYSTMIWTSDNTHPYARIQLQYSSMLAYPAATMSCHVSNHKLCSDPKIFKYRYHTALGGALGYEMHLPNAEQSVRDGVKEQIENYRKYEDLILKGDYYSIFNPFTTNYSAYYYTDANNDRILLSFLQYRPEEAREVVIAVSQASENAVYLDEISGNTYTGEQLRNGIKVITENDENNSQMWYLVKKN